MRIIFMGTPAFALPALQALIDSEHEVVAVYSQPPRPAGRGQKLTASPVHQLAEKHHIPVFTSASLKNEEAQHIFASHQADAAVVAAYGLILPMPILQAPKHGCINIHPSDLPRWRGAAPIQRTIMAGDTKTACCIMQMDEGLDTGPVFLREPYALPADMSAGELHDIMAQMGARLTLRVLNQLETGKITAQSQAVDGITYAEKISKTETEIDWTQPAQQIHNHIRGLSPIPAAYSCIGDERVKILKTRIISNMNNSPAGCIFSDKTLHITAGDGHSLELLSVKRPGKSAQQVSDIIANWPLPKKIELCQKKHV